MKITKEMIKADYPPIPLISKNARPPSTHKSVFKRGERIKSIAEFSTWIFGNQGWVYLKNKAYHPAWAMGWSIRIIFYGILNGNIYKALKINEFEGKYYPSTPKC